MHCKQTCLLLLTLLALKGFAQTSDDPEQADDVTNVAKVTFLNPGLGYELRIARHQTVHAQAFMNTSSYAENTGVSNFNFRIYFDPAATLQYRYYYNAAKRLDNGKRIARNSMNYVAAVGEIYFSKMPLSTTTVEETSRRPVRRLGVVWGLQRNFEKHFSLDLNVGAGMLSAKGTYLGQTKQVTLSQATLMGQINLGFWFGGK